MDIKQQIKDDILNNKLARGVPLRQVELSQRYGVSRIPIRDALLSLKAEGWLSPHGKAGVMVPALHWKEAEDLSLMRAELECLLLDMAFDRISEKELNEAKFISLQLDKEGLSLIERGELNWHFHQALYKVADRPTLQRVVEGLNQQAVRYLGFQYGPLGYRAESQHQHEELLSLIQKKNKYAAIKFLRQHIEDAGVLLTKYLKGMTDF